MNNFFALFKVAKDSDDIEPELALFEAVNANLDKVSKAQFDAGYDLGLTHGKTGKVKPLYSESVVSEAILKKAIKEVLELTERFETDKDGNPPFTAAMGQILNRALEGVNE